MQIQGWIGNVVQVNDREQTCRIAWWMPTGGPYGSAFTDDVPLTGLHVRQQATTSTQPAPSTHVEELPEWEALVEAFDQAHEPDSSPFRVGLVDRVVDLVHVWRGDAS